MPIFFSTGKKSSLDYHSLEINYVSSLSLSLSSLRLGYSSVRHHMATFCKAMCLTSSTVKKKKKGGEEKQRKYYHCSYHYHLLSTFSVLDSTVCIISIFPITTRQKLFLHFAKKLFARQMPFNQKVAMLGSKPQLQQLQSYWSDLHAHFL